MTLEVTQSAFLFPSCQDPGLWKALSMLFTRVWRPTQVSVASYQPRRFAILFLQNKDMDVVSFRTIVVR